MFHVVYFSYTIFLILFVLIINTFMFTINYLSLDLQKFCVAFYRHTFNLHTDPLTPTTNSLPCSNHNSPSTTFEQGKRNPGSASDYSYTSHVSAGGTRHVTRRRKRADGTYSAAHSYHRFIYGDCRQWGCVGRDRRSCMYRGHQLCDVEKEEGTYSAAHSYHRFGGGGSSLDGCGRVGGECRQ